MAVTRGRNPSADQDLQVGQWQVLPTVNQIRQGETVRHLEPQVMDLLVFLSSTGRRVVSKNEIIDAVWEGRFIADATLTRSIAELRRELGDSSRQPRYIETIAKRGYRLVADVTALDRHGQRPASTDGADGERGLGEPCLVVLPFTNLGQESEQYFCDGLTDDIINALTRLSGLRVISRTSAFAAHARGGDIADIGRSLGVTHAIEGSVRWANGRLRVTAQLIQVSDHCHVWSEQYDRSTADVFAIQDDIADTIARRLELTLDRRITRTALPTAHIDAYSRFLEGRHHFLRGTHEGMALAKQCFADAIRLDPSFAMAHDALSEVYWYLGFYGMAVPKEVFTLAVWESLRALEIDDRLAEAHALLAMLRKELDYNWSEVDREYAVALELNPRSPVVRLRYAICGLMPRGQASQAARVLESVVANDPLSIFARWWLASMYWFSGQREHMRGQVERMVEIDPSHPSTLMMLGTWQMDTGDLSSALTSYEKAAESAGRTPWFIGWLGLANGLAGRHERARALLDELLGRSASTYVAPFSIAVIALGLGDHDSAFHWMDRAVDLRDPMVLPILNYPFLESLRPDPRFSALVTKMNLDAARVNLGESSVPGSQESLNRLLLN